VLLIALGVRSYWWVDGVKCYRPLNATYFLVSANNELRLEIIPDWNPPVFSRPWGTRMVVPDMPKVAAGRYCRMFSVPVDRDPDRMATSILGFRLASPPAVRLPVIPHWFAVTLIGAVAVMFWPRSFYLRFSLSTLLIATTLVAVVLGLIVWQR
jgi:hypothetical protein